MNATRLVAGAAVLTLLAGAAWWLAGDRSGATVAEPPPTAEAPGPEPDAPAALARDDADDGSAAPTAERTAVSPTDGPAPIRAEFDALPDRVAYRVHVLDERGAVHPYESGTLTVVLWSGSRGAHARVDVANGLFTLPAAPPAGLGVQAGVLGGRAAVPTAEALRGRVTDPVAEPVVLRWPPRTTLRVVDAATGEDLNGLEFSGRAGDVLDFGATHPGEHAPSRRRRADSPFVVDPADWGSPPRVLTLFARAPGYAWNGAQVNVARGGEHRLELVPGGDLEVTIVGEPLPGSDVRVRTVDPAALVTEASVRRDRPTRIDGVPAGEVRVTVEKGEWFDHPVELGSATAVVEAGGLARVEVVVESLEVPDPAPLSGLVVLPATWELEDRELRVERLGETLGEAVNERLTLADAPREGTDDEFPFDAGLVEPGRYLLELDELETAIAVEVPPEGLTDVRFEVGAPGEVVVRTVDAHTGAPVQLPHIAWHAALPPNSGGYSMKHAKYDEALGGYLVRAPIGEATLSVHDATWTADSATVAVGPAPSAHVLPVRRKQGFRLALRDGDRAVDFEPWGVEVEPVGHEGTRTGMTMGGETGAVLYVDAPGEYRVTIPAVGGYTAPEPATVLVPAGEVVELTVQLERKP